MLTNIGLYSYGAAFLIYTLLGAQVFLTRHNRSLAKPLLVASVLTAVWAGVVAGSTLLPYPQVPLIQLSEVARNAAWCFLLLQVIRVRLQGSDHFLASSRWIPWFGGGYAIVIVVILVAPAITSAVPLADELGPNMVFSAWLAMAIFGLLLLEQIFRNSNEDERWSIKHLCLGLGILFAYDFFMYAEALLFRQLDTNLWQARGIVISMTAIFVGIGFGRIDRPDNTQRIYISRHVAFHSVTLLAAGVYLLAMALAGYFIRYLGGSWGGVLQIIFLCATGLLLIALLFSGQIRARTRVWLSKNFFSYKYDYRVEWLQFTQALAKGGNDVPENIIRAMATLAKSPGGMLWSRSEENRFIFTENWGMADPGSIGNLHNLPHWLQESEWIIDLREWRRAPDLYEGLELPIFFEDIPRAWLIIPLLFGEQLQGILLLRESDLQPNLNWEDRDLLKVAGRQAASHLAQYQANQALVESRQFDAFNRLSAYVIHDLKNILAQQALIVSNAEKHKRNPEFVDDMIMTVENSVNRMTDLMEQMRSGVRGTAPKELNLPELLQEVVISRESHEPKPRLTIEPGEFIVMSDNERLQTVFGHLIQNAQEASNSMGQVNVRLCEENGAAVVEIEDNGKGMDAEFLKTRLFKPFDSTKGLTGMGIGAFESREFIRSLGGDIKVESEPGHGSLFRVFIPCVRCDSNN